jgi:hypothetical protein
VGECRSLEALLARSLVPERRCGISNQRRHSLGWTVEAFGAACTRNVEAGWSPVGGGQVASREGLLMVFCVAWGLLWLCFLGVGFPGAGCCSAALVELYTPRARRQQPRKQLPPREPGKPTSFAIEVQGLLEIKNTHRP